MGDIMNKKLFMSLNLDKEVLGMGLKYKDGTYEGSITGYNHDGFGLYLILDDGSMINWKSFDEYEVVKSDHHLESSKVKNL